MNSIAFIFSSAPHGSSSGREGLDALLSLSAINKEVGVFFVSDGVFQIIAGQHPYVILARDYIATFRVLSLYNIENICVCISSMQERGLEMNTPLVLDVKFLLAKDLRDQLTHYNVILKF